MTHAPELSGFDELKAGALVVCCEAFSLRELVSTSLENALSNKNWR